MNCHILFLGVSLTQEHWMVSHWTIHMLVSNLYLLKEDKSLLGYREDELLTIYAEVQSYEVLVCKMLYDVICYLSSQLTFLIECLDTPHCPQVIMFLLEFSSFT